MRTFKICPHCGSSIWVIPIKEPDCYECGCDTDIPADEDDDLNQVDLQIANLQQEKVSITQNLTKLFQSMDFYNKNSETNPS